MRATRAPLASPSDFEPGSEVTAQAIEFGVGDGGAEIAEGRQIPEFAAALGEHIVEGCIFVEVDFGRNTGPIALEPDLVHSLTSCKNGYFGSFVSYYSSVEKRQAEPPAPPGGIQGFAATSRIVYQRNSTSLSSDDSASLSSLACASPGSPASTMGPKPYACDASGAQLRQVRGAGQHGRQRDGVGKHSALGMFQRAKHGGIRARRRRGGTVGLRGSISTFGLGDQRRASPRKSAACLHPAARGYRYRLRPPTESH